MGFMAKKVLHQNVDNEAKKGVAEPFFQFSV